MTLARSWEAAQPGAPPEVAAVLATSDAAELQGLKLLLAMPEYQVALPGGTTASQTDVLAVMRGPGGLVAVAVEGKVDETFGPTIGEKRAERSAGVDERLAYLVGYLGLSPSVPETIRYQLAHRTVSAVIVAEQFHARAAVMLVHSFSPTDKWFDDFEAFAGLFDARVVIGGLATIGRVNDTPLHIGWCKGDQRFRQDVKI
jgi:hypothetical protein